MDARRLSDLLSGIRSKNAGPFLLTIDLFFKDRVGFQQVVDQRVITPDRVADAYRLDATLVEIYAFEPALAIKVTWPREIPLGSPGDRDVLGGQQFAPFLDFPLS
jgi:hypothetical protein